MRSRVVIDHQALATGCVHWKRTVPYSSVVKRTAQTIYTGYKETSWFLSLGIPSIICVIGIFIVPFNFQSISIYFYDSRGGGGGGGGGALAGKSRRAEKSHWQVQKVTLAGPKSHTRAKMSHWSVIIKDFSMMYRALWDRRHEGATRISQCTRHVAPSALTYPIMTWIIWFWYITKPKFACEIPKREEANHAL